MTIEDRLKALIIEKYGSIRGFSLATGLANSTVMSILNRGIHNAIISNVIVICQALGISADGLAEDKIIPADNAEGAQPTDIGAIIAFTRAQYPDLTMDGQTLTQDETELILDALEISLGIIRRKRERM